jgi:hypothetical protein
MPEPPGFDSESNLSGLGVTQDLESARQVSPIMLTVRDPRTRLNNFSYGCHLPRKQSK